VNGILEIEKKEECQHIQAPFFLLSGSTVDADDDNDGRTKKKETKEPVETTLLDLSIHV
jgi:hypothetical protein